MSKQVLTPKEILENRAKDNPQFMMLITESNNKIIIELSTGNLEKACFFVRQLSTQVDNMIAQNNLNSKLNQLEGKS